MIRNVLFTLVLILAGFSAKAQPNWQWAAFFNNSLNAVIDCLPIPATSEYWGISNGDFKVLDNQGNLQLQISAAAPISAAGLSPDGLVYAVLNGVTGQCLVKFDPATYNQVGPPVAGVKNGSAIHFFGAHYFIADRTLKKVRKFETATDTEVTAGFATPAGTFTTTEKMADDGGNLLVADSGKDKVIFIDPATGAVTGEQAHPNATGVGFRNGILYIAANSGGQHTVAMYENGVLVGTLGGNSGTGQGQFNRPESVRFDYLDRMVVAENVNDRVQLFYEGGPLPIEIADFYARLKPSTTNTATLTLVTASESNTLLFSAQVSQTGTDWQTRQTLAAAGNSTTERIYTFEIPDLPPGISYFRVEELDNDGSRTYTPIVSLNIEGKGTVQIYPSPSNGGTVTLDLGSAPRNSTVANIYDASGRLAMTVTLSEQVTVFAANLPPGSYNVIIGNERETLATTRLVIQ